MTRFTRAATTIVLALAWGAVPLVADWCAISCEAAAHSTAAAATTPACHHVTSSGVRVSRAPVPCGHDHHGMVIMAAANLPASTPTAVPNPAPAVSVTASMVRLVLTTTRAGPPFGSSAASIPLALSSTLRI